MSDLSQSRGKRRARVCRDDSGSARRFHSACSSGSKRIAGLEPLEPRCLLSVTITQPVPNQVLQQDTPVTVDLTPAFQDVALTGTLVQMQTSDGTITLQLFDSTEPVAVQNFLGYTELGLYNNTIIHRVVNDLTPPPFQIIQGGGYKRDGTSIPTFGAIPYEPGNSNVRGTIAMARLPGDPNSATSQWFINDSDNSALDTSDGGYTVFGKVIAGMNVVDKITALPTADGTGLNGLFDHSLPVQNTNFTGSTPPASDLVDVTSVSVLPKVSFKVSSDNVKLVNATAVGNALTIAPVAGQSGIAHVTVSATDLSGQSVSDTFRVEVKPTAARSLDVTIGAGHGRSVGFRQGNGLHGSIALTGPGTAVIHFAGDDLRVHNDSSGIHVAGSNISMMGMDASGTTPASSLTIRGQVTRRKGVTQIGDITDQGAINTVRITRAQLVGDMTVAGGVGRFFVDYARGGTVDLGSITDKAITYRNVSWFDENLTTAAPFSLVRSFGWGNSDNVSETFQAPYVKRLISYSSFTPGLQLSGAGAPSGRGVRVLRILGTIGGTWSPASTVGIKSLTVGGIATDFNGTFAAPLRTLVVRGNMGGSLTAPSIGNVRVLGAMGDAALTLQAPGQDLPHLTARQGINSSLITAAGNIGAINARYLISSDVLAGIGALPAVESAPSSVADLTFANFTSPASIGSISLNPRPKQIGFSNSNVAAAHVGTLSLGTTFTGNGGTPFGVATTAMGHFAAFDRTQKKSLHFTSIHDAATLAAQVAAQKVTLGDLQIKIVS